MDPSRIGHARTKGDHDQWRMRDVQRRQSDDRQVAIAAESLKTSMITAVNPFGDVQLEAFSDEGGEGQWFSCLNNVYPEPGQNVVYGIMQGSVIVLGVIPDNMSPWKVPTARYWSELDHFHTGFSADTSGNIGSHHWKFLANAGALFQLAPGTAGGYGYGWVRLHTNGGASAQYSSIHSRHMNFHPYRTREIEFGFVPTTISGVYHRMGLTGHIINWVGGGYHLAYDTAGASPMNTNWCLIGAATTDTGIPVVAGHYYVASLRSIGNGAIECEVTDWETGESSLVQQTGNESSTGLYLAATIYARDAVAGAKILDIDYIKWTNHRIILGAADDAW